MCSARVFSRGQHLQKSSPKRSTFRRSKLSEIVPKRSTFHSPNSQKSSDPVCPQGLYAIRGFVCPQGTCMPSRDLYALKGFVCPQGTCMPSRDLGPMGRAHMGPGPGPRAAAGVNWFKLGPKYSEGIPPPHVVQAEVVRAQGPGPSGHLNSLLFFALRKLRGCPRMTRVSSRMTRESSRTTRGSCEKQLGLL